MTNYIKKLLALAVVAGAMTAVAAPEKVISINFNNNDAGIIPETSDPCGLKSVPGSSWNHLNQASATDLNTLKVYNGTSADVDETITLIYSSPGFWNSTDASAPYQKYYLDARVGANDYISLTFNGLPNGTYDIIFYSPYSGDSDTKWRPWQVGETWYTSDDEDTTGVGIAMDTEETDPTTTFWGERNIDPAFGKNAMIVKDLKVTDGSLTCRGQNNNGHHRVGSLAAVQLIRHASYDGPNPIATWNRDFTRLTNNGFTISGGEVSSDAMTIASSVTDGAILVTADAPEGTFDTTIFENKAATIIVEYADYEYSANLPLLGIAAHQSNGTFMAGVAGVAADAVKGVWQQPTTYTVARDGTSRQNASLTGEDYRKLSVAYANAGTSDYVLGTTAYVNEQKIYQDDGLRGTNLVPFGFAIGGLYQYTGPNPASVAGMTVRAIAIFDTKLTDAQIAEFVFPEPTTPPQTKFMKFYYPLDGDATNLGTSSDEGVISTNGTPVFVDGAPFGSQSMRSGNTNGGQHANSGSFVLGNGTDAIVTNEQGWTLSFWFNSNGMGNWRDVCGFNVGSVNFKFEKNGNNELQMYNGNGLPDIGGHTIPFTPNEWMNITVVSKDEEHFTIYAKGVKILDYPLDSYEGETKIYGDGLPALTKLIMGAKGNNSDGSRESTALSSNYAVYDYVVNEEQIAYLAANEPKDFYAPKKTVTKVFATLTSSAAWGDIKWKDEDGHAAEWTDGLAATITVDADATLTLDTSVEAKSITFLGSATLTLDNGATVPAEDFLAKIKMSKFTGSVLRSWVEKARVIAINFNATAKDNDENGGSDEHKLAENENADLPDLDVLGKMWTQVIDKAQSTPETLTVWNTATGEEVSGLSATATWRSNNNYMYRASAPKVIRGYLDDGGAHASVEIANIPFDAYDVIVLVATDSNNYKFNPVTVNGVMYKWDGSATVQTLSSGADDTWGLSRGAKIEYGLNALRIPLQTAKNLSILGGANANTARGGIAGVVIVESTAEEYNTECDTVTSVSAANALNRNEPIVNIHLSSGTVFAIDAEPARRYVIVCDGDEKNRAIVLNLDEETYGATIPAEFLAMLSFVNCDPVVRLYTPHDGYDNLPITKIYHYVKTPLTTSLYGNVYMKGAGAAGARQQIQHNGGWAELRSANADDVYYLAESFNGTDSTVRFIDAKVDFSDIFGIGMATYELKGTTEVTAPRFILSQGGAGRTSNFLMQDTAKVTISGESNPDTNQSSIMFGHWDGPSTFTIRDNAEFHAPLAQILVGKTRNNQTINIEGGVLETKGIKLSASASGTNTLNLNGGTLKLGDFGITRYGTAQTLAINLGGLTTIEVAEGVTAPISTFPLTPVDPDDLTHAIIKTGAGTLDVGTNRPRMDVREGKVRATVTLEETVAGKLILKVPEGASQGDLNKIELVDESGAPVTVADVTVDPAAHTVMLLLDALPAITGATTISALNLSSTQTGIIGVIGAATCEEAYDITFDKALPAGVSLAITGHVNLVGSGVSSFPGARLVIDNGGCAKINKPLDAALTLRGGATLILDNVDIEHALTLQADSELRLRGNVTAGEDGSLSTVHDARLVIEPGATLTYPRANFIPQPITVHNYGTIEGGSYEIQYKAETTISEYHLYAGSVIHSTSSFKQMGGSTSTFAIHPYEGANVPYALIDAPLGYNASFGQGLIYAIEDGAGLAIRSTSAVNQSRTVTGANIAYLETSIGLTLQDGALLNGLVKTTNSATLTIAGNNAFGSDVDLLLPVTLSLGSTTQTFDGAMTVAEGEATAPSFITSESVIVKKGAGKLVLGNLRPVMDVQEGSVQIIATEAEIENSSLTLNVKPGASPASDAKVVVVSGTGEEIPVKNVAMGEGNTVIITLGTSSVTTSTKLSEMDSEILSDGGAIAVIGGNDCEHAIDIIFDIPVPENVSLTFSKHVNLKVANDVAAIPLAPLTFNAGACVALDAPVDSALTVPADVTVKARATMDLTLTNNGTFVVTEDVTATVTASGSQAIKGTVTIEKGATFVNQSGDAISYGNPGTTVNIYGTLVMGETRWTVGGQSQINLYGSAEVTGVGDNDGILDIYRDGNTINVFNVDGEDPATATIEGLVRTRNANGNIWIQEGAMLALPGGLTGAEVGSPKLTRKGNGHLSGTIPLKGPLTLDYGSQQKEIPAHFAVTSGEVTFHVSGKSGTEDAICVNDSEEDPFFSVAAGATLKLKANNLSGSLGELLATGRIHVAGTLVMMDGEGSRYFRQPLVLADGATMKINSGSSPLILMGGAGTDDAAQISLAEGSAEIIVGETNGGTNGKITVGTTADDEIAAAVFVGEEATLTIATPIDTLAGAPKRLAKKGAGTLVLTEARPYLHVAEGLVAIYATVAELARGEIRLPYPTFDEGLTATAVQAFDPTGGTLDGLSSAQVGDELVFTFRTAVITTSALLSDVLGERTRGSIVIEGPANHEDEITFTLDVALPEEMEIQVSGHVKFAVANGISEIPSTRITRSATSCIGFAAPFDENLAITVNQTVYYYAGVNPTHQFNGAGHLVFAPAAPITVSQNNSGHTGPTTLESGTVKMGNNNCFGASSVVTTVRTGATLDFNGRDNFIIPITLAGGAVINNGSDHSLNHTGLANTTFTEDSFVGGDHRLISIAGGWNQHNYNLNGHTLTKIGAGNYANYTANYVGGGRIVIREGTYTLNGGNVMANTTLAVDVERNTTFAIANEQSKSLAVNGTFVIGGVGEAQGFNLYPSNKPLTIKTLAEGCLSFNSAINAQTIKLDVSEITAEAKVIPLLKVAAEDQLPETSKIEIPAAYSNWILERMPGEEVYGYRLMRPNFVFLMVGHEGEGTSDPLVVGTESFEGEAVSDSQWMLSSASITRKAYEEGEALEGAGDWYWHVRVESDTTALTRTFTNRDNWINNDARVVKMSAVIAEVMMKFPAIDFEPVLPATSRLGLWLKNNGTQPPTLMVTCGRVVGGEYEKVNMPLNVTITEGSWHKVKIESYSDPDPSYAFGVFTITIDGETVAAAEGSIELIDPEYVEDLLANTRERELYAAHKLFPSLAEYSSPEAAELVGVGFLGSSDIDSLSVTAAADDRTGYAVTLNYEDPSLADAVKVWINGGEPATSYKAGTELRVVVTALGNTEFAADSYAGWTKNGAGELTQTIAALTGNVALTIPAVSARIRAVTALTIEVQAGTTLEALSINGVAVTPTTKPEGAKQGDVIRLTFAAVEGYILDGDSEMTVPLAYGVDALAVTIKGPGAYREGNPPQTSVGPKTAATSFKLAIRMEGGEPVVSVEQLVTGGAQSRLKFASEPPHVVIYGSEDLKNWEPIRDPAQYKNYHFFKGVIEE